MYNLHSTTVSYFNIDFQVGSETDTTQYTRLALYKSQWEKDGVMQEPEYKVYQSWYLSIGSDPDNLKRVPGEQTMEMYTTFEEADNAYQTLCLKAFAKAMSNRGAER